MKCLPLVFLGCALTLKLCGNPVAGGDTAFGIEPAVAELAKALAKAERVEIYEGLPSPVFERNLFDSEKSGKICRQIAGEWFYSVPQEMKLEDSMKLQRLVGAGLLQPWRGEKLCGGFHADWAIALSSDKSLLSVLICFGCHEVRLLREGKPFAADLKTVDFRVTTDLKDESFAELVSLLTAYRKERPAKINGAGG